MTRRTDFRKANTYTGQKIKGPATLSYKIDGVRVLFRDGQIVTRNNKIPRGLETACTNEALAKIRMYGDCEIFMGSFKETSSTLSQGKPTPNCILADMIYPLVDLDKRLVLWSVEEVIPEDIEVQLNKALALGYEGLVLRTNTHWYRVKPTSTATVKVTGYFEQYDKHAQPKGILGGFYTKWGKVTAFDNKTRELFWKDPKQYIGQYIEVQYKERYNTGKFRYAVKFIGIRDDRCDESFDTEPPKD